MWVHIYQHHRDFGPGSILDEARNEGLRPRVFDMPGGEQPIRDFEGVGAIVFCGGPWSAKDFEEFPWLRKEIAIARAAAEEGIPILGVGFGSHILALALGASVSQLSFQGKPWAELGWGHVNFRPEALRAGLFRQFPQRLEVLHWHTETFSLPPGAKVLASSPATPIQAFVVNQRHVGLQFHLELGEESIERIATEHGEWLKQCGLSPLALTMDLKRRRQSLDLYASQFFGRFFSLVTR